jgi:hypothetical protein
MVNTSFEITVLHFSKSGSLNKEQVYINQNYLRAVLASTFTT